MTKINPAVQIHPGAEGQILTTDSGVAKWDDRIQFCCSRRTQVLADNPRHSRKLYDGDTNEANRVGGVMK